MNNKIDLNKKHVSNRSTISFRIQYDATLTE